jgi:ABC-2 type transport system permease protein
MANTSSIEVHGLCRRYGGPRGFEAVRNVSFSVAQGELFALLGTNGAGKTSTLEVAEGLARPSAGRVRVLGQDPSAGSVADVVAAYPARISFGLPAGVHSGQLPALPGARPPHAPAGATVLFVAAGAVFLGLPVPVNVPVLALGALGGAGVFVVLAAASSAFTRTVEMAQITTLPVLFACVFGSGLVLALEVLPPPVANVLRLLPLTPPTDLMRLGWLGTAGTDAPKDFVGVLDAAILPSVTLAIWAAIGVVAVARWFRWEPRR